MDRKMFRRADLCLKWLTLPKNDASLELEILQVRFMIMGLFDTPASFLEEWRSKKFLIDAREMERYIHQRESNSGRRQKLSDRSRGVCDVISEMNGIVNTVR